MSRRATVYLTDRAEVVFGAGSLSGAVNRVADRYYEIVRRSRVDLACEAQWNGKPG